MDRLTDSVPPNGVEGNPKSDLDVQNPGSATPPHGAGSAAGAAPGIPLMVTRKMRAKLEALGYTKSAIDDMTPAEAWEALDAGRRTDAGSATGPAPGEAPDPDRAASTAVAQSPPQKKRGGRGKSAKKPAAPAKRKPSKGKQRKNKRTADGEASAAGSPAASPLPPLPKVEPFTVYVRPLNAQDKYSKSFTADTPIDALKAALAWTGYPSDEPVIGWKDATRLAVVDADWHHLDEAGNPIRRLDDEQASALVRLIEPEPKLWWRTHGGGLRLVYTKWAAIDADAQAALAIFHLMTSAIPRNLGLSAWSGKRVPSWPTGVEIKTQTRHPLYPKADGSTCGAVSRPGGIPSGTSRVAGKLLGTAEGVEQEAVDAYLEENNWERARAYPHDRCLINPGHGSHGTPVWVGDHGIVCLSCQAQGLVLPGCNTAGFVPWMRLVDPDGLNHSVNLLRNAVRHCCHWRQARHVMRHCVGYPNIAEELLEKMYRALLQLGHLGRLDSKAPEYGAVYEATKERIGKVFYSEAKFVRATNEHVWEDDYATPIDDAGKQIVAALPAAMYVEVKTPANGQPTAALKVNKLRAATLKSNKPDLSEFGYAVIDPIVGVDVGGVVGAPGDGRTVPALLPAAKPFRYRSRKEREEHRERDRWMLESQFPGLDPTRLRLYIAAKGYSQRGFSEPTRFVLTGQSGAGKTTEVRLAAEMTGEPNELPQLRISETPERFLRDYAALSRKGSFVLTDEFAKPIAAGGGAEGIRELLLNITRSTRFHRLFVGGGSIGRPAVHILADTTLPDALKYDAQLGRRTFWIDLGAGAHAAGKVNWRDTCGGDVLGWRTREDGAADVSDRLISDVMDAMEGHQTFESFAAELGYVPLAEVSKADGGAADAAEFFLAVLNHPTTVSTAWRGDGWKVFQANDTSDLARAWKDRVGEHKPDVQTVTGERWGLLLDIPGLVCEYKTRRAQIGLRFSVGKLRSEEYRAHEAVIPPGHPLAGKVSVPPVVEGG